jgi:hypothetical protein
MAKKYVLILTDGERGQLFAWTRGRVPTRTLTRAYIVLQAEVQAADAATAEALRVGTATVERTCQCFVKDAWRRP